MDTLLNIEIALRGEVSECWHICKETDKESSVWSPGKMPSLFSSISKSFQVFRDTINGNIYKKYQHMHITHSSYKYLIHIHKGSHGKANLIGFLGLFFFSFSRNNNLLTVWGDTLGLVEIQKETYAVSLSRFMDTAVRQCLIRLVTSMVTEILKAGSTLKSTEGLDM